MSLLHQVKERLIPKVDAGTCRSRYRLIAHYFDKAVDYWPQSRTLEIGVLVAVAVMNLSLHWTARVLGIDRFDAAVAIAAEDHLGGMGAGKPSTGRATRPFVLRPGVVVDPIAGRLYMMNPKGGIDAVQLDTGKLLWMAQAGAKPLTVFDQRLVAMEESTRGSHALPIVLLDTKQSGRVDSSIALPMPAGAVPSVSDGPGSSSSVDARVVPDGLIVWWTVTGREIRAIPRPVRVTSNSGAALINPQTHQVTTLTPDQAAAKLSAGAPPSKAPQLNETEGLYIAPEQANGFFVAVKLGPASVGQPAVLKRWSAQSGKPLPDIDLGPGYEGSAISADQSLFLMVRTVDGGRAAGLNYVWTIYSIANGQRVAQVRLADSVSPFFIWDSILIYESAPANRRVDGKWLQEPLGLRGLNLKTGTEVWNRALRDTSYHGTYPPHP